jgi:hypothetical protein
MTVQDNAQPTAPPSDELQPYSQSTEGIVSPDDSEVFAFGEGRPTKHAADRFAATIGKGHTESHGYAWRRPHGAGWMLGAPASSAVVEANLRAW